MNPPTQNPPTTPPAGALPGANGVPFTVFPAAPAPAAEPSAPHPSPPSHPSHYTLEDLTHAHHALIIWREETTRLLAHLVNGAHPATLRALEQQNAQLLAEAHCIHTALLRIQTALAFGNLSSQLPIP